MKHILLADLFALVLILTAACTVAPTPTSVPSTQTSTAIPPSVTPILTPLPSATATFTPTNTRTWTATATKTPTPKPTQTPTLAPEFRGRFSVVKSTAKEETDRIWGHLREIDFYDQNNYKLIFPNDPTIQLIVQKARDKKLENRDYDVLKLVLDKVYNPDEYEKAYQKVIASFPVVEQALPTFQKFHDKWGFKIFPQYTVRLTLYATGGSFDYNNGVIILQTDLVGTFARGPDPSHTIIHESVHIGIEQVIAQKYQLEHWVRERLVDRLVYDNFIYLIPTYRIQPTQASVPPKIPIEKYLDVDGAWDNLPERVSEYNRNK